MRDIWECRKKIESSHLRRLIFLAYQWCWHPVLYYKSMKNAFWHRWSLSYNFSNCRPLFGSAQFAAEKPSLYFQEFQLEFSGLLKIISFWFYFDHLFQFSTITGYRWIPENKPPKTWDQGQSLEKKWSLEKLKNGFMLLPDLPDSNLIDFWPGKNSKTWTWKSHFSISYLTGSPITKKP